MIKLVNVFIEIIRHDIMNTDGVSVARFENSVDVLFHQVERVLCLSDAARVSLVELRKLARDFDAEINCHRSLANEHNISILKARFTHELEQTTGFLQECPASKRHSYLRVVSSSNSYETL